jgi:[acyl-carrier-protein] S-malonyltransferase
VSEDDALRITVEAHRLASHACARVPCGMVAIVGLEGREVEGLVAALPGVSLAIRNGEISHVVSGPQGELTQLVLAAEAAGATRALFIEREAPYHHPGILKDAAQALRCWLATLSWTRARCPLISTIDARVLREPGELQEFTAQNLCSPIDWEKTVLALAQCGATTLLECGIGNGLTKLGRFIDAPVEYVNLKHLAKEPQA